ncbi:MAG: FAD-binding oxidoreductase [Chloroflexota bacterium]
MTASAPASAAPQAPTTPYQILGARPGAVLKPRTPEETAAALRAASDAGHAVVPWGAGTKQRWGNAPTTYDVALDLTALDQILEYEPADLVITAQAGMPLAALQAHPRISRQFLPLGPPYAARATRGGRLATNASGPSRLLHGTARDMVLGIRVATPQGDVVKSGGRVVKNVVGYDLNKLHVGGLGTAGVIVEVTFKVQPLPAAEATVAATFGDLAAACTVASRIARSALFPRAVELLREPASAAWQLFVWCAGAPDAVDRQVRDTSAWCGEGGSRGATRLDAASHDATWQRIAGAGRGGERDAVLKLTCLPSDLGALLARLPDHASVVVRAGSGVAYVTLAGASVDDVRRLSAAAHELRGSGVVEEAPDAIKRALDSWDPAGLAARARNDYALMHAIKEQFDPRKTLNPGRFVAGI